MVAEHKCISDVGVCFVGGNGFVLTFLQSLETSTVKKEFDNLMCIQIKNQLDTTVIHYQNISYNK